VTDVRRNDLARVQLDTGTVSGFVTEIREEVSGHERVVIKEPGDDGAVIDTSADRGEVADR